MANEAKLGESMWIQWPVMIAIIGAIGMNYSKWSELGDRATRLEVNSEHANRTLEEIASTLKSVYQKQDGEAVRIGEHEVKIESIEKRMAVLESNRGK